jgi:glycosyltransferase involved in cell wall biosynthesis
LGSPELAVIIPAFNEEKTIARVVADALSHAGESAVVIVSDDGSRDATAQAARDAGADVVSFPNGGYEMALERGFARAVELGCAYAVTIDADGQLPAERIGEFRALLEGGAGLVCGVRDRFQRFGEAAFGLAGRLFFGMRDPLCGMKGYDLAHRRALGHFDSYRSVGTELALYAIAHGARLAEVEIATRDREDQPRFGRAFSANMRILRALAGGIWRYGWRRRSVTGSGPR